ncbi:hypothetical protein EPI10_006184 [Gossypium australe]|uniref:Uncharacterized protein n=1 Tax=Gossypium australe TaxID=47621 RepID=A0A5B6WT85_9ROSI|nr:hypothetical protein EPI10_006184 [Gossypium australe]
MGSTTQQLEARALARAYVVWTREEGDATDVVVEYGVILDCRRKKILIQGTDRETVEVNGIRSNGSTRVPSSAQANKLMN